MPKLPPLLLTNPILPPRQVRDVDGVLRRHREELIWDLLQEPFGDGRSILPIACDGFRSGKLPQLVVPIHHLLMGRPSSHLIARMSDLRAGFIILEEDTTPASPRLGSRIGPITVEDGIVATVICALGESLDQTRLHLTLQRI